MNEEGCNDKRREQRQAQEARAESSGQRTECGTRRAEKSANTGSEKEPGERHADSKQQTAESTAERADAKSTPDQAGIKRRLNCERPPGSVYCRQGKEAHRADDKSGDHDVEHRARSTNRRELHGRALQRSACSSRAGQTRAEQAAQRRAQQRIEENSRAEKSSTGQGSLERLSSHISPTPRSL